MDWWCVGVSVAALGLGWWQGWTLGSAHVLRKADRRRRDRR